MSKFKNREEAAAAFREKIDSKERLDELLMRITTYNKSRIGHVEKKERRNPDSPMVTVQWRCNYHHPTTMFSYADFDPLAHVESYYFPQMRADGTIQQGELLPPTAWWVVREWVRLHVGAYDELPPVLARFNTNNPFMFAIPHPTDTNLVLFTDTPQNGARDIKTPITFGRLLRRAYPFAPDEAISDSESAYRADLSCEIEFITGEEIVSSYLKGPASCMTKSADAWRPYNVGADRKPVHPIRAYVRDEFALAVLRNGDGDISARALTWINPDDANDKRYVRVYGDATLQRRLKKKGYVHRGLAGARLNKIPVGEGVGTAKHNHCYLMPYVDTGPSTTEPHYAQAAVHDGDSLLLVNGEVYAALSRLHFGAIGASQHTSGYTVIKPEASVDALNYTCPVTGITESSLKVPPKLMLVDGKVANVHPTAVEGLSTAQAIVNDRWETVYIREGEKTYACPGRGLCVRTPETLEVLGLAQLEPALYGEDEFTGDDTASVSVSLEDDTPIVVRACDVVDVITMKDGKPAVTRLHKSAVAANSKAYRKLQRIRDDVPCVYAVGQGIEIVHTECGMRGVLGIHPIAKLWDGKTLVRNGRMKNVRLLGKYLATRDGEMPVAELSDMVYRDGSSVVENVPTFIANALRGFTDEGRTAILAALVARYRNEPSFGGSYERTLENGHVQQTFFSAYPMDNAARAASEWVSAVQTAEARVNLPELDGHMRMRHRVILAMHAAALAWAAENEIDLSPEVVEEEADDEQFCIAA